MTLKPPATGFTRYRVRSVVTQDCSIEVDARTPESAIAFGLSLIDANDPRVSAEHSHASSGCVKLVDPDAWEAHDEYGDGLETPQAPDYL